MEKIKEIKIPKGVESISVAQHDDKIVIDFIPEKRKFKEGDKVKIKDGISSKTHSGVGPCFTSGMDKFIGKELTVKKYSSSGFVVLFGDYFEYHFAEDWLEPWSDDAPKRKFKAGDKVALKSGCTSNTGLIYLSHFDEYIGKELTVYDYTESGNVRCNNGFRFAEDWLEPWSEELKKGDLAIFWDNDYRNLSIRLYHCKSFMGNKHYDNIGSAWDNAVKWDGTKEQFEKVLRGEIN